MTAYWCSFSLRFPKYRLWHFKHIIYWSNNLHEMSNSLFWKSINRCAECPIRLYVLLAKTQFSNEYSDQLARMPEDAFGSLATHKLFYKDWSARMHRLIWVFAGRRCSCVEKCCDPAHTVKLVSKCRYTSNNQFCSFIDNTLCLPDNSALHTALLTFKHLYS